MESPSYPGQDREGSEDPMAARPFIPVANTVSVEMIYIMSTVVLENVMHVEGGAPFSGAQITTLRGVFDSWHNVSAKSLISPGCSLARIRTKALDSLASPYEDYTLPSPRAGTAGGALMPGNQTFAVKLSSGLTGRSARGRIYWPPSTDAMLTPYYGTMNVASAAAIVAAVNTLIANITAANAAWHLVITSYMSGKAWRGAGVNYRVTGAGYSDLNLDSQRRRLPGRGRT